MIHRFERYSVTQPPSRSVVELLRSIIEETAKLLDGRGLPREAARLRKKTNQSAT